MRMRLRIAVLRSDDAHHKYLDLHLTKRFDVVCRVIEPAAFQRQNLLSCKKYKQYIYALYHTYRRRITGLDRYRKRYFALPAETLLEKDDPVLVVQSVNDPRVVEALQQAQPEVVVIICTSILGKELLHAIQSPILNVHGGFLPFYRGNHCFFFAMWNRDFDHIGSTIHFVDRGIDTGDIVEVIVPDIYAGDNPETLYCRADKIAIGRLIQWLQYYEQGGVLPRTPQTQKHALHQTHNRGPVLDLRMWFHRITKRLVVTERRACTLADIPDAPPP